MERHHCFTWINSRWNTTDEVYLSEGSAYTLLYVTTLRQKLLIRLAVTQSHSQYILTSNQPVLALTPSCQASGMVTTSMYQCFKSTPDQTYTIHTQSKHLTIHHWDCLFFRTRIRIALSLSIWRHLYCTVTISACSRFFWSITNRLTSDSFQRIWRNILRLNVLSHK